jgi:hypothetical protein
MICFRRAEHCRPLITVWLQVRVLPGTCVRQKADLPTPAKRPEHVLFQLSRASCKGKILNASLGDLMMFSISRILCLIAAAFSLTGCIATSMQGYFGSFVGRLDPKYRHTHEFECSGRGAAYRNLPRIELCPLAAHRDGRKQRHSIASVLARGYPAASGSAAPCTG